MSADLPFKLRGGNDKSTALHNRIAVIERIKFLTDGIDLRKKSTEYMRALDLEMWTRWYRHEPPNKLVDEEFCQRAAEVVKAMEATPPKIDPVQFKQAKAEHQAKLRSQDHGDQHTQSHQENAGKTDQQIKDRVRQDHAGRIDKPPRKRKKRKKDS